MNSFPNKTTVGRGRSQTSPNVEKEQDISPSGIDWNWIKQRVEEQAQRARSQNKGNKGMEALRKRYESGEQQPVPSQIVSPLSKERKTLGGLASSPNSQEKKDLQRPKASKPEASLPSQLSSLKISKDAKGNDSDDSSCSLYPGEAEDAAKAELLAKKTKADCEPMPQELRQCFIKIMNSHSMGIAVDKFLFKFKTLHGYYPDHALYGYSSFLELAADCQDIFKILSSPLAPQEPILFPSGIKKQAVFSKIEELFSATWTQVKEVLDENGSIVKISDIPQLMQKNTRSFVDPSDWSFMEENSFYKYATKTYNSPTEQIFIISSNPAVIVPGPGVKVHNLLVKVDPEVPKTLELFKKKKDLLYDERIQASFAQTIFVKLGERIPRVSDNIPPGTYLKCLGGAVHSPGHFYVILAAYWNQLEHMMTQMNMTYNEFERNMRDNTAIPYVPNLKGGLYVAVRRKSDGEWHRGQIIKKVNPETYLIFFIDYGDLENAEVPDIRYLFIDFKPFLAQAIRCVAQLGHHYNRKVNGVTRQYNLGVGYTHRDSNIFRRLIFNKNLAINFRKKTVLEEVDTYEVWVHTLIDKSRIIDEKHVERRVLKKNRGSYKVSKRDETEKELNLETELTRFKFN